MIVHPTDPLAVAPDAARDVTVVIHDATGSRERDRALLAATIADVTGVDPGTVRIEQVCADCGGDHGQPVVLAPTPEGARIHASLSRAVDILVIAVTLAGPIGVDIESADAIERAGFDDVALDASERAIVASLGSSDRTKARISTWTAKEAILKAAGLGLRVDPRELVVGLPPYDGTVPAPDDAELPALLRWADAPFPIDRLHLMPFSPAGGILGMVAVVSASVPLMTMIDRRPSPGVA